MMPNLEEYFHKGVGFDQFIEKASTRQNFEWFYDNTTLSDDVREFLHGLDRQINVLVVATHWCIDCQANVPVMAKIADTSPAIDVRIINRDDHPDFMQHYLTNGGMKVPLCLFLSTDYREVSRWVERPTEAYRLLYDLRVQGLEGDELYAQFKRRYRSIEMIEDTLAELIHHVERTELVLLTSRRLAEQLMRT